MEIAWYAVLAAAGSAVVWLGSTRLETASERIARHHRIPEVVKGAVITAVASSFPELASVIVATLVHGEFELGVATIVGSAVFNILVIPGVAVLAGGALPANQTLVYKEGLFYMVAVLGLLLTFSLAAVYHPAPGEAIRGTLDRSLAALPLGLYAVYLFIQYHDLRDERTDPGDGGAVRIGLEWAILLGSMALIWLGVELLVRSALAFGRILGTPSFLWGLTIVAAGTSLPDLFISVQAAREKRSVTSLANVLGSNTFDLLVAVPAGVVLGGATVINFSHAAPMMGCLGLATLVLFAALRWNMDLRRGEGVVLLILYLLFVAWMGLESFGVVSVLRVSPP